VRAVFLLRFTEASAPNSEALALAQRPATKKEPWSHWRDHGSRLLAGLLD